MEQIENEQFRGIEVEHVQGSISRQLQLKKRNLEELIALENAEMLAMEKKAEIVQQTAAEGDKKAKTENEDNIINEIMKEVSKKVQEVCERQGIIRNQDVLSTKMSPLEMLKEMQNKLIETIETIEGFTKEHAKKHVTDKAERAWIQQQENQTREMLKHASRS